MKNDDTRPSRRTLATVAAAAGSITLAAGVTLGALLGVVKMPAGAHGAPTESAAPHPAVPRVATPEPEAPPVEAPAASPSPDPGPAEDEAETDMLAQRDDHERRERHHEGRHGHRDEHEESEHD